MNLSKFPVYVQAAVLALVLALLGYLVAQALQFSLKVEVIFAAGLAIGLALQGSLSNLAAGVLLLSPRLSFQAIAASRTRDETGTLLTSACICIHSLLLVAPPAATIACTA